MVISHVVLSMMGEASIIARCEKTGTAGAVWGEWHNVAAVQTEITVRDGKHLWPAQTFLSVLDTLQRHLDFKQEDRAN